MASLSYLWRNRAQFNLTDKALYKAWAKRVLTLPELLKRNLRRKRLISGGAIIHELAEIGQVKMNGKKSRLQVGKYSFLGNISIALHEQVFIGERVCINDGVELLTASHDVSDEKWSQIKKKIVIEDYVWIGTDAMILPGVTIGRGAVVGARAVVGKSVAPETIVVGNPAKPITKKRNPNLNYNPCELIAANRAWLIG